MRMMASKFLFKVERKEINYIQSTIESYDGMAVVRTVDPEEAIIELSISPGCESMILALLDSLREQECIEFIRIEGD